MQVPLIVGLPGVVPAGTESDQLINQVRLFPTLVEVAGMGDITIDNSPGGSFAPTLHNEKQERCDAGIFEYITVRAITTRDWKFVKRLFGDPPELYDLNADPGENVNLADSPDYAEVMADLDARLTAFFDEYSTEKYDVWHGGTAEALLMYNDRNEPFEEAFPNFVAPYIEKLPRFSEPAH